MQPPAFTEQGHERDPRPTERQGGQHGWGPLGVKSLGMEFQWGLDTGGGAQARKGVSDRGNGMCEGWEDRQGVESWEPGREGQVGGSWIIHALATHAHRSRGLRQSLR